ncbi:uncharacterized protein LTR77_006254 [Saxophila tyrrhenica]|uniref:Peptidase A1 domain-containing protein n=1 Tax=Saxophila tyrrhenica TaxID=1690608 RepID=A0AAV9P820_9PEZI|nr:hypothetical protein LTR77_006254 [Saxophila tyrrhenica]
MGPLATLLLALISVCSFTHAAAVDSFSIASHRDYADSNNLPRKRQSGSVPSELGKTLYWFANFSVGDADSVRLLIDTGSTDLLMNEGVYKPSKNQKPYKGHKNFTITYEGVSRGGFGFETLNGTTMTDTVSAGGLTVKHQAMGSLTDYKYYNTPPKPYAMQGDGIIGFAGARSSSFTPGANSWFWNLCKNKAISQCKLGLLFGTSGKGQTVLGKRATHHLKNPLTTVPDLENTYIVRGDITLNNHIVLRSQYLILDSGTDNIQAPLPAAHRLFSLLNLHPHTASGANPVHPHHPVRELTAFFPCSRPPVLGFSFPPHAELKPGQKARVFNVLPEAWGVYPHGEDNCTSILGGTNALDGLLGRGTGAWLVGQSFFQGHYVEFDLEGGTIGFGDLVDPGMEGCA